MDISLIFGEAFMESQYVFLNCVQSRDTSKKNVSGGLSGSFVHRLL